MMQFRCSLSSHCLQLTPCSTSLSHKGSALQARVYPACSPLLAILPAWECRLMAQCMDSAVLLHAAYAL